MPDYLRTLLNLPSSAVADLKFHELAALVYRDIVQLKHMKRARLEKELADGSRDELQQKKARLKSIQETQQPANGMLEMVIEHLVTVTRQCQQSAVSI